ncbi:hypothetical protein GGQ97_002256 [Sphingomonas kaistensis]|uniref:DUF465 domain-containing protein n=1 Tax=Sphingomonas kaistensis TaxID=298708 RepID=A0A7X5Y762_9SPHN|nr:DUF465 domain-containing protein [Sphingomonas kaistensis]NJC06463.1 hypothetical protein [Sphingomonas kaistensis]
MNDDQPTSHIEALRVEHRRLDAEISARVASGDVDLMTLARLKKRKLRLKDELQMLHDAAVPDIIA